MIAVKGLFDGKRIQFLEKIEINEPQEVIITFLGSFESQELYQDIRTLAETGGAFDFLNNPEDDIYSDEDLKVKYTK